MVSVKWVSALVFFACLMANLIFPVIGAAQKQTGYPILSPAKNKHSTGQHYPARPSKPKTRPTAEQLRTQGQQNDFDALVNSLIILDNHGLIKTRATIENNCANWYICNQGWETQNGNNILEKRIWTNGRPEVRAALIDDLFLATLNAKARDVAHKKYFERHESFSLAKFLETAESASYYRILNDSSLPEREKIQELILSIFAGNLEMQFEFVLSEIPQDLAYRQQYASIFMGLSDDDKLAIASKKTEKGSFWLAIRSFFEELDPNQPASESRMSAVTSWNLYRGAQPHQRRPNDQIPN